METDQPAGQALPEKVAGVTLELELTGSFAERIEVSLAYRDAMATEAAMGVLLRVYAAALGLCWPRCRRYMQKERVEYDGNVLKYGGKVLDFLGKQPGGVDPPDVIRAGRHAVRLCEEGMLTKAHAEAAEGFSQAPTGSSSSSSSQSSASGGSSQGGSGRSSPSEPRG